jgi:2-dehydropantoate 2-reductase
VSPRIAIIGAGGIGGIVGALLDAPDDRVVLVSPNRAIVSAIRQDGVQVEGASRVEGRRLRVVEALDAGDGSFDVALLATPPVAAVRAAEQALPHLAPDGVVVCLQNGLTEERVAEVVGPSRVLGAVVRFGASQPRPGQYERTSKGGFVVGRFEGAPCTTTRAVARALAGVGAVSLTSNLRGARWSKLAINCAISTLGTIAGARLGEVLRHAFARRLALEIVGEALAVARAQGVVVEPVAAGIPLDALALLPPVPASASPLVLAAKHAAMLALAARYGRLRSSMLAGIERGRPSGVEWLNGEIVRRGAARGLPTPVNAAAEQVVRAIERGDAKSSPDALRSLFDATRP